MIDAASRIPIKAPSHIARAVFKRKPDLWNNGKGERINDSHMSRLIQQIE